jgi:hypothetical protein
MTAFSRILCVVIGTVVLAAPALAQQKTVRACQAEWRANKAQNQAAGITEKAYVAQCRTGAANPAQAPSVAPAPAQPAPAARTSPPPVVPRAAPTARTAPSGMNQFASEGQAKTRCPGGTIVWANLSSRIYHFSGHRNYGNTKSGAYMCEQDAQNAGIRAAKNERHP